MTTRKRVAARRSRAPSRPKKRKPPARSRKAGTGGSRHAAYRTYAPELLANVRQRYEETPEPVPLLAADLGIVPTSLYRLARDRGWVRRNDLPPRDVPPALRILQEAAALDNAGIGAAIHATGEAVPLLTSPRLRGEVGERSEAGEGAHRNAPPLETSAHPDPLPATGERERAALAESTARELSIVERLQRAVLAELATIEAMRAAMGTLPQKPPGAARTVRTLGMLTQTLQHLQRLRASAVLAAQQSAANHHERDHDDRPADIDEYRRELARRIDAFVASRTKPGDAGGDPGVGPVEEPR